MMANSTTDLVDWAKTWRESHEIDQRMSAIHQFGKAVKKPAQWKQCWDYAGGTAGLVELLFLASAKEVATFCKIISLCKGPAAKSPEREKAVQELVTALLPQQYPSSKLQTQDKRPLQHIYTSMLVACASDFVEGVLQAHDQANPLYRDLDEKKLKILFTSHAEILKRRLADYMLRDGAKIPQAEMEVLFKELVFLQPQLPGDRPNISASMQFALELLEARLAHKRTAARWPEAVSEMEVLMSVFRRYNNKSNGADKTFLFELGFRLIEADPKLKRTKQAQDFMNAMVNSWKKYPRRYDKFLSEAIRLGLAVEVKSNQIGSSERESLLSVIIYRWKSDPKYYEGLLSLALRQELGGTSKAIGINCAKVCDDQFPPSKDDATLRWQLLRLYCMHVPEKGVDIEGSSGFETLANQHWPYGIFAKLHGKNAAPFLQRLYDVNPCFDFLISSPFGSIYDFGVRARCNFNVELLLAVYQQGTPGALSKASEQVDRLRKTAATWREPEGRACYAKAAAHYAIASGNLELYGETILWQQRFICDPAAVITLFAREAMLTPEGIALLSGIPSPIPEDATLGAIRQQIDMANGVLQTLSESFKMAKRGPFGRGSAWEAWSAIYSRVYRERLDRAVEINIQPHGEEPDLFHIIWKGTADLTRSIGSDFLIHGLTGEIGVFLIKALDGSRLLAATQTLRKALVEWKQEKAASPTTSANDESIGNHLQTLVNTSIKLLSLGDTSAATRDLILDEIMSNPADSNWHRQILTVGFLKNLPAKEAEAILVAFAAAIGEKLDEQSYIRVGEEEAPKSAPPHSIVKVSTVKHLAQIIKDADFISPDSALEVLVELFKAGTHIDIRLATLSSLLSTFDTIVGGMGAKAKSDPSFERIMTTLEKAIPLAGNIDERLSMSEADWAESRAKLWLPTISQFDEKSLPSLFSALLDSLSPVRYRNLAQFRGELFSRLVLPCLKSSQRQYKKYLSVFLAKHAPEFNADVLPAVPLTTNMWHTIMKFQSDLVPSSIVAEYNEYVLFRMRLPKELEKLSQRLWNDPSLRNDESVRHWKSMFGESDARVSWKYENAHLFSMIKRPGQKVCPSAILADSIVSQASLLLDDYENCADEYFHLVMELLGPAGFKFSDTEAAQKRWRHECEVADDLARRLISVVVQKRASHKSSNNDFLPTTFTLRLWSLPYPYLNAEQDRDADCRLFTTNLDACISSFLESDEGDVLLWDTLVRDVHSILINIYTCTTARLRLAVHIGDLDHSSIKTPSAPALLVKVMIAQKLIDTDYSSNKMFRKPTLFGAQKTEAGDLALRMCAVMEQWRRGGRGSAIMEKLRLGGNGYEASDGIRDMFSHWRRVNKTTWEAIDSWRLD